MEIRPQARTGARELPREPEELEEALERTGRLASLAPEYTEGRAPDGQRKGAHPVSGPGDYYGLPAIKAPDWKLSVPIYFFVGGMASGAYIYANLADMQGRNADRTLVRAGRYLALTALSICPALLISDLGRPERWHHMLRVFRPRSMMNQGSWGITIFGAFAGLAVIAQVLEDAAPRSRLTRFLTPPLRALSWLGIVPAAYVGSYTGVLLSATNVPLWAGAKYSLGPLFFSSAFSSGLAGTHLVAQALGPISEAGEEHLARAESLATVAELAFTATVRRELGTLAAPLTHGTEGIAFRVAVGAGMLLPLALRIARKAAITDSRKGRWLELLGSVASLAGAALLKWSVTEGGKRSAADPQQYFEYTRPKP